MAAYLHLRRGMKKSGSMNDPSERGFGVQAFGFAVVGFAGVAILQIWSESSSWAYQSFETAVSRLYWAFVVPLAALFDWGRRMFETREAIRRAAVEKAIEKAVEKAVEKALEEKVRQISERAETLNIPREDVKKLLEVES
ncbi:MAG: hypothetical protein OXG35_14770 [Acidobacteria bacterium]|nr:hypothetical protein [Acidobacteriota bacterium]